MDIVEELRTNREAGARRLESEYKAGLMTLAVRFCADAGDAEELVNRTLAAVVEGIDGYVEQSAFFAWMCRILSNIHAKDIRRKANAATGSDAAALAAAEDPHATDRVFQEVDAGILRDAIEELPEEIRKTVILHYFTGMPVRDVARFLVVPSGTIAWRLHYARLLLGAKLGAAVRKPGAKTLLLALLLGALAAVAGAILSGDAASGSPPPAVRQSLQQNDTSTTTQQKGTPMTTQSPSKPTFGQLAATVLSVAAPLAAANAATTSSHLLYEPDSYVQDGLVVMYDGIRNAGLLRAHDASATTWADLSASGNDGVFGAAPDADCYWTGNGFYLNGAKSYVQTGSPVASMTCMTVEAVGDYDPQAAQSYPNIVSLNNGWDCGVFENMSTGEFQWKTDSTGMGIAARPKLGAWKWDKKGFAATAGESSVVLHTNAVAASTQTRSNSTAAFPTAKWNIGINATTSQFRMKGRYNAFRLYNRALTPDEIAANWQLDQYRFVTGIPTTNALIVANLDGIGGAEGTGAFAVDEVGYTFAFPATKTANGNTYALVSCTVAEWDEDSGDWSATETAQAIDAADGASVSIANTDRKRITLEWSGPPAFAAATVSGDVDTGYTFAFTVAGQRATAVTVYGTDGTTVLGSASGDFAVGASGSFALDAFAGAQLLTAVIANASGSVSAALGAFAGGAKVYAYDDFGGYGTAAVSGQAPEATGFSASSAWAQQWPTALRGQAANLSFPDFLSSSTREGSVYRRGSDGYSDSAKRALAADAIPSAGTFCYRFVFRQSAPEDGKTWLINNDWYHSGNSLGLSPASGVRQGVGDVWYNDKQIGAGPMPNADFNGIGIYLRTGWGRRTELVAPEDYAYDTDYLVCVEVTVSESGNETFRAFAQKVADCTKANTVKSPPWVECTACATDIVSASAPFAYLTLVTHSASGLTGSIAFDEFRMGATLADVFPVQRVPGFVLTIR